MKAKVLKTQNADYNSINIHLDTFEVSNSNTSVDGRSELISSELRHDSLTIPRFRPGCSALISNSPHHHVHYNSVDYTASYFIFLLQNKVDKCLKFRYLRTAETYIVTLKSFLKYFDKLKHSSLEIEVTQDFNEKYTPFAIDISVIEGYEAWLRDQHLMPNTISFYIKHLRAVYRIGVEEGIFFDTHPFKHLFTSVERTVKRALPLDIIRRIKDFNCTDNEPFALARDLFLFSFYTRGMSFVDIVFLRKDNLKDGMLVYRRTKTKQQLSVRWESCMAEILNRYKATNSSPYLFNFIDPQSNNPRRDYLSRLCYINRYLKIIGNKIGLNQPLTMYVARHSWASIARDAGVPIAVISEGMGHNSEATTRIYLSDLSNDVIDTANKGIINLL